MVPVPRALDAGRPSPDEIRAYLARLLGHSGFRASTRRRELLAYVIEQTLAGRAERLKAFDLACAVLGRDERFDPQNDPIVRIEIGRLRRDLEQYYLADGARDFLRISIPKGRYVPAFDVWSDATPFELGGIAAPEEFVDEPASEADIDAPIHVLPSWNRHLRDPRAALVLVLCALAVVSVIRLWPSQQHAGQTQAAGPALVVVPFEGISDGEGSKLLASGLTHGLIMNLMRFDGLQVFAAPAGGLDGTELPSIAAEAPAYVLTGSVQREPDRVQVTAMLTDRTSSRVFWSQGYDQPLTAAGVLDLECGIAGSIASRLAQVYGVVNDAATRGPAQPRPETMFSYDCVQRAFAFRRTFNPGDYGAVRACLEEAVQRNARDAGAWAMLAFAHMDAARFGLVPPGLRAGELDAGLTAAQQAVELAPGSARSLQSLAALQFARGEFAEAERVQRQAIALNPHDPEGLAQLGWRLMARGQWDEGATLLRQAIDRSLVVPAWYHDTLALALYLGGDLRQAREEATLGKDDCCTGYATLAIAEAALGHVDAARAALQQAVRQSPLLSRDPVAFWANFQGAPHVIARLNAGLAKAGLVIPPPPVAVGEQSP